MMQAGADTGWRARHGWQAWFSAAGLVETDPVLALKVVQTNVCAVATIVFNLFFNGLFWWSGNWGLQLSGLVQLPFAVLTAGTLVLNRQRRWRLARLYLFGLVALELCVIILAGQGTALSVHYYLLLMTVLSLALFPLREWRYTLAIILGSISLFTFFQLQGWPSHPALAMVPEGWLRTLRHLVLGSCVVIGIVVMLMTEATSERAVRRLEYLATMDALTRLPNRRACMAYLAQACQRWERQGEGFAVAMVDIDHFKAVNDEEGHDVGDDALRHVAALLRRGLRAGDMVARMGGEEFAIVLPASRLGDALLVLQALCRQVAETPFVWSLTSGQPGGRRVVTVSLGVSVSAPGCTVQSLLRQADTALYQAKSAGRNRVVAWTAPAEA